MKCPHCSKDIAESLIVQESARIAGRKGKRTLTPEQAREMVAKRKDRQCKEKDE